MKTSHARSGGQESGRIVHVLFSWTGPGGNGRIYRFADFANDKKTAGEQQPDFVIHQFASPADPILL